MRGIGTERGRGERKGEEKKRSEEREGRRMRRKMEYGGLRDVWKGFGGGEVMGEGVGYG